MAKFYDPLTERWYTMPERPEPRQKTRYERFVDELDKLRAPQLSREHARVWEAVTATATASQMSTETQCPDGSESDASAS